MITPAISNPPQLDCGGHIYVYLPDSLACVFILTGLNGAARKAAFDTGEFGFGK